MHCPSDLVIEPDLSWLIRKCSVWNLRVHFSISTVCQRQQSKMPLGMIGLTYNQSEHIFLNKSLKCISLFLQRTYCSFVQYCRNSDFNRPVHISRDQLGFEHKCLVGSLFSHRGVAVKLSEQKGTRPSATANKTWARRFVCSQAPYNYPDHHQ